MGAQVEEGPERRLFLGQFNLKFVNDLCVHAAAQLSLRSTGLDRKLEIPLGNHQFALLVREAARPVALHDVIDVDMSPAAGAAIDDVNSRLLAQEIADVPGRPIQRLTAAGLRVRSGGGADDFPV